MSIQTQLQTIQFYDRTLTTFEQNNVHYVAMKPICENIGLDWKAQYARIKRDEVLSQGMVIITIPSQGGEQQTLCLPIQYLNGWLFGIDVKRVKPEIRETLITYKRECYQALFDYWNKGKSEKVLSINENDTITPEEQRLIQNAVAATHQRTKMSYGEIWARVKNKFAVAKYEQIKRKDHRAVMIYIASMHTMQELPPNSIALDMENFYMLAKAMNYINHSVAAWERLEDLFSDLESHKNYKTALNLGTASNRLAQTLESFIAKHTAFLKNASIREEIENLIFNSPRTEQRPTKTVNYLR
ncbi:phage antirepressor N-terminal domain-containing protein [Avibacterium paragallinarum]|uniref:Antirepressor protein ant N-terminal domain-containing protein n=2 Tax=Avibacterium paragallinarum TaxID=728 RepID=A0ABU7QH61_AVIPA